MCIVLVPGQQPLGDLMQGNTGCVWGPGHKVDVSAVRQETDARKEQVLYAAISHGNKKIKKTKENLMSWKNPPSKTSLGIRTLTSLPLIRVMTSIASAVNANRYGGAYATACGTELHLTSKLRVASASSPFQPRNKAICRQSRKRNRKKTPKWGI